MFKTFFCRMDPKSVVILKKTLKYRRFVYDRSASFRQLPYT
jgi:hypothetical protein